MSKPDNSLILFLALVFTVGLSVGGLLSIGVFWLLNRVAPESIAKGQQPAQKLLTGQLTILGDTFSGYSTFRSPTFGKELKEVGVSLRYADEFNQAKRAELLRQGQADLLVTTLDQFLKQKPPGKIVGLIDRTVGADAVVLNTKKYPNLKSILDLNLLVQRARSQGQQLSIVFASDTPSEYLALVLSTKFESFKLSDFQLKRVADASEAWEMLQDPKENVAVAIVWEPYVTRARKQGYTVVLSSRDTPGIIVDAIVASNRLLQSQPDQVSDLLSVYYRRIDANIRDASQLQNQIATDGGLSPSDAAIVLQGIEFFTAVEAKTWLTDGTLEKRLSSTAAVLTLAGRMNQVPQSPRELFTAQPINKAASNTQTLIGLVRADNPELADRLAGRKLAAARRAPNPSQLKTAPNIGNLRSPGEVQFNRDSAELTAEGMQTLDRLVKEIAEFNPQTVALRVIGHTSHGGVAEFNQILSQRRAQVVADYLRSRQLRHNIVAEGKGSSQPLANISPHDFRNQRTEIRLVRIN